MEEAGCSESLWEVGPGQGQRSALQHLLSWSILHLEPREWFPVPETYRVKRGLFQSHSNRPGRRDRGSSLRPGPPRSLALLLHVADSGPRFPLFSQGAEVPLASGGHHRSQVTTRLMYVKLAHLQCPERVHRLALAHLFPPHPPPHPAIRVCPLRPPHTCDMWLLLSRESYRRLPAERGLGPQHGDLRHHQ